MMKHVVWLLVAVGVGGCAPDEPRGPKWYTADGERTELPPEDVESVKVSVGDLVLMTSFSMVMDASGDVRTDDHRFDDGTRRGAAIAEVSASQWARVSRALGEAFGSDRAAEEERGVFRSLKVMTTEGFPYDIVANTPEGRAVCALLEELAAELEWKVPPSEMRPIGEDIVAVSFQESWNYDAESLFHARVESSGNATKTDRRDDHEHGVFRGKIPWDVMQPVVDTIAEDDSFAVSGAYATSSCWGRFGSVAIEYSGGRTIVVSGSEVRGPEEVFAVIEAIKDIDAETLWVPR